MKSSVIGFCSGMFVVFLTLKLAEVGQVAHWSWWWVTSPLWIPMGIIVGFLGVAVLCMGVAALWDKIERRKS